MSMTSTPPAILGGPELPQERRLVTSIPGPRSLELAARRSAAVASPVTSTMPVYAAAAGGGVIVDVDGNSLIDLGSGIAVTGVGNSAPEVVEAVSAQAASFIHTCFMVTPYENYVELAETLNALAPVPGEAKTALFNSGAEAVENAVKVARSATGRQAVVALDHAYHGRTNLTMELTAKNMPYKNGFGPFAPGIYRAPGSYPLRDGLDGVDAAARTIQYIERSVGVENLAALIVEPVQGEGGFIVPAEGFLPALVTWARAHGVVFIADEVQTGFARTGAMFAVDHESVEPDIVVMAKGIAGGMPLSAITGRAELMDHAQPGGLGGTYGGNPVACAAALAAIRSYADAGLVAKAARIEEIQREVLGPLVARDPRVAEFRGRGAMCAIEIVDPATGAPDAALTGRIAKAVHAQGVVLLTAGSFGNVVRVLPPLTIGEDLLREALQIVVDAIEAA